VTRNICFAVITSSIGACAPVAQRATPMAATPNVIAHERLGDPYHPYGSCIYLGKAQRLDQQLAAQLLATFAPDCARESTIVNVAPAEKLDLTPVASGEWPGGDIASRGRSCVIHADLRTESGALVFANAGTIGLVCVSVENLKKAQVWHADLVFMLER